jgi:Protein of unknown function DUF2625
MAGFFSQTDISGYFYRNSIMKRLLILFVLTQYSFAAISQTKMRPLDELINKTDPGWAIVKEWIESAKNKVEILPVDTVKAKDALFMIQVSTRSPMGAIVYMSGGLLVDNGWIRILGSGNSKLNRTLPGWNKGKTIKDSIQAAGFLLIADDVIGGFFILNGGVLGKDLGKVYYFSPDNLEFEPLDLTYSEFLNFCFNNDLNKFYEGYRWENWKEEVAKLSGNEVFNFVPALWTKEGKDFAKHSRTPKSVEEQFAVNISFRKQLGIDK